ncbi:MAG: hypothetical protein IJK53_08325 [Erysipelotrichaceae bacterium]|nr:hypothetical protein [Erysipelotrichaceae bacterium]
MRQIDKTERDRILKNPYITANEVYQVLPVGKTLAYKLFKELYDELDSKGVMLFKTMPRAIPMKYFKERYL